MKITGLRLKEFTAFSDVDFEFSPGLNVLLGANATGKSHTLKVLYSVLKAWEEPEPLNLPFKKGFEVRLAEKLASVFMPDGRKVGRLVKRGRRRKHAELGVQLDKMRIHLELSTLGKVTASLNGPSSRKPVPASLGKSLFLPTRELLSMFPGFIHAYSERHLEFDETYYDLCVALSGLPLKGPRLESAKILLEPLEQIVLRSVVLKNGRFYLKSRGEGTLEAHLAAEGLRKLGSLMHLISNGSLDRTGILFWDEPETNLNPKLVTTVAKMLLALAAAGVQVFVATHDYLLTNELSLAAEYETKQARAAQVRFFCLCREKTREPIEVQTGNTIGEIDNNPILEEFAAHYDRQQNMFAAGANRKD